MVALTMITYSKYLQPKIERKSYIMSNREETEELVPVNIDAVFPNMPCACKCFNLIILFSGQRVSTSRV